MAGIVGQIENGSGCGNGVVETGRSLVTRLQRQLEETQTWRKLPQAQIVHWRRGDKNTRHVSRKTRTGDGPGDESAGQQEMSGRRLSEHDTVSVRSRWRSLALLEGQEKGTQQACRLAWGREGERTREASVVAVEGRGVGECGRKGSLVHCPGKWESVERVCTGRGDESRNSHSISMVKRGVSATSVRVGTCG
ncbi:hypothetical protein BJV77DRAFT_1151919 [Russula vinacea]|nr:hypothetical protein BJV77DRAFT_1151919 [Russula vinacea]